DLAGEPARRAVGICRRLGPRPGGAGRGIRGAGGDGAVDPSSASAARRRPAAVAAAGRALAATRGALRAVAGSRGGGRRGGGAGQQRYRELEQPPAELLLLAAAVGAGLPGAVAVLPQPPAVPAERALRAGGQESGRIAGGRAAPPLVGSV